MKRGIRAESAPYVAPDLAAARSDVRVSKRSPHPTQIENYAAFQAGSLASSTAWQAMLVPSTMRLAGGSMRRPIRG